MRDVPTRQGAGMKILSDTPPEITYGDRVRIARSDRGWSQRELARHIGISNKTVARIEAGKSKPGHLTRAALNRWLFGMASVDSNAECVEETRQHCRREWADYFEHWTQSVGPEPLSVEVVIALLRADREPFGFAVGDEGRRQP
jgi:transcriptional regulator with XRE-family HTH domain